MARPIQLKNGKWRVRWTNYDGVRGSQVLDTFKAAATYLKQRQVEAYEVKHGLRAVPQPVVTFFQLCNHWLSHKAANKRSGRHDETIIRLHLKPNIGDIELNKIKPSHADKIKLQLKDRTPKTVHNILTLLSSLLNCAHREGWMLNNVSISKPTIAIIDRDYRYIKTQDEIVKFLTAAAKLGDDLFDLYAVTIHTGMRAGEIGNLKFNDIDFDQNLIHVTGSWGGETKSSQTRVIPLLPAIKPILLKRLHHKISPYVFCNSVGNPLKPSDRVFQEKLKATLDLAEFPKVMIKGKEKYYSTFHGLRHTFASHWMMRGLDLFRLQKTLGHQSSQITERYSHMHVSAFKDVYDKAINGIPDFSRENVIGFKNESVRENGHMSDITHQTPSIHKTM